MRPSWLAILPFLALAACGGDSTRNESAAADQVLANDRLTGNDLTAIDAVSGSDANMAADVDFNALGNNQADSVDGRSPPSSTTRAERPRPSTRPVAAEDEPQDSAEPSPQPPEANSN